MPGRKGSAATPMTSRLFLSVRPAWLACPIRVPGTRLRQASADGASRRLPGIVPGNGDLTNRYPGTTQNLLHINPRASADKNLEPMPRQQCKRPTVSKRCEPLRTVGKNNELQKKLKELLTPEILPPEVPPAVEAIRPNLPMPAVNQRREVKARWPKPHNQTIEHHRFPKAVREAEDPT